MADGVQPPYTPHSSVGMVFENGRPEKRQPPFIPCLPCLGPTDETLEIRGRIRFPEIKDFGQYRCHDWSKGLITDTVIECLRLNRRPPNSNGRTGSHDRFKGNVTACRSRITADDLRRLIATKTRLDLEQAAGFVVAAFIHENRVEDAAELVQELEGVLATSCMWTDDGVPPASRGTAVLGVKHLCEKLPRWCARIGVQVDAPQTMSALIHLLLRFRRHAPQDRCLHVPAWMFEESGLEPPDYTKAFVTTEFPFPTHSHTEDVIILSRKTFRALQRCIFRLFRFWKPECRLPRDIDTLKEQVLFATDWVEKVTRESKDIAKLCYYFFNL